MNERVAVGDLRHGMFVAELDRAWLGTPFLIQGFLIEHDAQIGKLQRCCQHVYVDASRSVGIDFPGARQDDPDVTQTRTPPTTRTVSVMPEGAQQRPDFYEVLRLVRARNEARRAERAARPGAPVRDRPSFEATSAPTLRITPQAAPVAVMPERVRNPGPDADDGGLLQYATSWLRPLSDWLRRDASASDDHAEDAPGGPSTAMAYKAEFPLEEEVVRAHPLYEEVQNSVEQLILELEDQRTPDLEHVRHSVAGLVDSVVRNPDAVIWLNRLKRTDRYTYDHALEVSVLLMVAGRQIGLSESQLTVLGTAGLLQDLGKLGLPPELLQKRGRITLEEYRIFQTHVARSLLILKGNPTIPPAVVEIVEKHHERIDGSGYPRGLRGEEIGVLAEMAGVADSYCAMTSDTGYRPAFTNQQALERLNRMRDVKFSAKVVDLFIQCIGLYPVGTLVKLNSGEVAVVIAQNRVRRLKPKVMVLLGPDKTPNRYPPTLDLLYDPLSPKGAPYRILRALPPNAYGIDPKEFYLA